MNTFYLIRHGQKVGEAGDPGLTKLGKEQSRKTVEFLKNENISKIYSSTLRRAKETAEIIDDVLKVGVMLDDRLRERMNWGSIPGQTLEEFLEEWEHSNYHRDFKPLAGISSLQAGREAQNLIGEIAKAFPGKNIAIVTHGGVVCDLLRNIFSEEELFRYNPEFLKKLDALIRECSLTVLKKGSASFVLDELGSTKHLLI